MIYDDVKAKRTVSAGMSAMIVAAAVALAIGTLNWTVCVPIAVFGVVLIQAIKYLGVPDEQ